MLFLGQPKFYFAYSPLDARQVTYIGNLLKELGRLFLLKKKTHETVAKRDLDLLKSIHLSKFFPRFEIYINVSRNMS